MDIAPPSAEMEIRELKGILLRFEPMLVRMDERLKRVESDVGVLKTDVGALKTDVMGLRVDLAELKGRVSQLPTTLNMFTYMTGMCGFTVVIFSIAIAVLNYLKH